MFKDRQIFFNQFSILMCKCKNVSYRHVYDEAYYAKDRTVWLKNFILQSRNSCLRCRNIRMKHTKKALQTQSIFEKIDRDTQILLKDEDKILRKQLELRLKFIQKNMLQCLYKPNGLMFAKSVLDLKEICK